MMQVHAVPDSERAFDSTGRKLPWAYEYADSDKNQRRIPEEKGPFGKARRRGTSRAKTPQANSAAEAAKVENDKAIDAIFSRFKADEAGQRSARGAAGTINTFPPSASAPNLIDAGGLSASFQAGASTNLVAKEPKEVILYGYGTDVQWAAISHFEKVSNGLIYEDYDREPYNPKLGVSFSGFSSHRASTFRTLDKSALRKVNEYVGGDHWIKVTFDSAEAAERACHYSPHSIQGYTVFAEPYRGTGPTGGDRPIRGNVGGALSQTASPNTLSSGTIGGCDASQSSATASSATAMASIIASTGPFGRSTTEPLLFRASGAFPQDSETLAPIPPSQPSASQAATQSTWSMTTTTALNPRSARATLRLKGANVKAAVFLPQEKAFLPSQPRWQQTVASLPIIGWVIGSGQGVIGDQVPRKEDGSFDVNAASIYWRTWYAVDACFGTDFCGVREAEYDE
ncbi:hypothetical protein BDU57DRAFT_249189 [Ampelomyces quisqualis]|uniref:Uncharacterized protein n=1 Tax=Ampelomyces quisqualis TaxID=50730 RepID=A0A6A5QM94_AMPQU|nr:hypothetical protein BDU57DRAFT_249189 [Ampelomyces quisqualis]